MLIFPVCGFSAVYKYLDASGNYVYSDKPHANATKVNIKEAQSMTWRPVTLKKASEPSVNQTAQPTTQLASPAPTNLKIVSPSEGQFNRDNQGQLEVMAKLDTKLTDASNRAVLFPDLDPGIKYINDKK